MATTGKMEDEDETMDQVDKVDEMINLVRSGKYLSMFGMNITKESVITGSCFKLDSDNGSKGR